MCWVGSWEKPCKSRIFHKNRGKKPSKLTTKNRGKSGKILNVFCKKAWYPVSNIKKEGGAPHAVRGYFHHRAGRCHVPDSLRFQRHPETSSGFRKESAFFVFIGRSAAEWPASPPARSSRSRRRGSRLAFRPGGPPWQGCPPPCRPPPAAW